MTADRSRMRERLEAEQALITRVFRTAVIDLDALVVIIKDHPLPEGWSHDVTDVLVVIPTNYPGGRPDNVCARPDLRLADGKTPANTMGEHAYTARNWLQFSWHPEESQWRATNDPAVGSNLLSYLLGAVKRFEEPS